MLEARPISPRARRRLYFWIVASAFLLRLLYFAEHSRSPFFHQPVLDEKFFDTMAVALVEDRDVGDTNPSFRSLLYPAYLAFCYSVAGSTADPHGWGYGVALIGQHLMGIFCACLVASLTLRVFGQIKAAVVSAALWLLAGPPLFFEGELLGETLFGLLFLLFVRALLACDAKAPWWNWVGAGVLLAVAVQVRPNVMIVAPIFFLALWQARPQGGGHWGWVERARRGGAALLGLLLTLIFVALLQLPWLGSLAVLPSAGGVNLYLGNKRSADGMIPRQDNFTAAGSVYQDSVQLFAEQVYREETGISKVEPAALSRFWLGKTLDEIAHDPGRWLILMGKKCLLLVWDEEIPNNKSYRFILREESTLLRWLPTSFAWLLALAVAGSFVAWPSLDRLSALQIWRVSALFGIGIVCFFVNARYRLPLWPLLAVMAGGVAHRDFWRLRGKTALVLAAGVLLLTLPNWMQVTLPNEGRDYFFRSVAHFERGNYEEARQDAQQAVDLDPRDWASYFQLGTAAMALGDDEVAYGIFSRVVFLVPEEPRGFNNLGIIAERLGRVGEAYVAYDRATQLSRTFTPPWVNAALLELRAGDLARARLRLSHLAAANEDSIPYLCARAFLARDEGDLAESERWLEKARQRNPELVQQLIENNQRRLLSTFQVTRANGS